MLKNLALLATLTATPALAEAPKILNVDISRAGMGWRISVTLEHPDSGWDHYADGWEVLDANGNRLAYRELMHPHVQEQPFTRSINNVMLPDGTKTIWIRSRCSQDGWSEETVEVSLP